MLAFRLRSAVPHRAVSKTYSTDGLQKSARSCIIGSWFLPCTKEFSLVRATLAFFFTLLLMAPAPSSTEAAGAGFRVAGMPMNCTDFRGRTVLALKVSNLGDVGRAWVVNTVPYILLDPELMRRLPKPLQIFFYVHECAHHKLGHWYNPTGKSEKEADCWAIEYGRDRGILQRQMVVDFEPWLAKSRGSAFGHLPGRERVQHLLACFDGPVETAQQ